ncbi:MAG: DUF3718 domain-containing protein [Kangiellaceae bacterium]|nr:DUF3718 domain-containing protein [Kangiellaceae bacterium]
MKKVTYLLLSTLAAATLPLSAAQYVFIAGDDSVETRLCIAAAENKVMKFKNTARLVSSSKSINRKIARKLKCNDQTIADFAYQYDAYRTVKYLDRYLDHDVQIRREISEAKKTNIPTEQDQVVYVEVN